MWCFVHPTSSYVDVLTDPPVGRRNMTLNDLSSIGGQVFECNKASAEAMMRAFVPRKYPRKVLVHAEHIVVVKIDDRGFVVHKWTRKIVDLKQVYLAGGLLGTTTRTQNGARLTCRADAHTDARTRFMVEYSRPSYEHVPTARLCVFVQSTSSGRSQ